jgi:hypothetical protein
LSADAKAMLIADQVRPALKENLELKHVKMFAVQLNVQAILFVLLTITVVTVNVKEDSMVTRTIGKVVLNL